MADIARFEMHRNGRWQPVATLEAMGDDRARVDYLPDYIFSEDPWPLSLTLPVAFAPARVDADAFAAPAFLYDLVPQGAGRRLLLSLLGLDDHERLALPLLLAGAFNPIGNLRVDRARHFYEDQVRRNPPPPGGGFLREALLARDAGAVEHLAVHAMLASGTTGVQGVAPKFLLAEDADGRLHADLALDDTRAHRHWLLKGPRGRSEEDRRVLRNEAAYLRVAAACGLRTHRTQDVAMLGDHLLVPRFDRRVVAGDTLRLAQESLASLAGLRGFGLPCRLNRLLQALRRHVDDPAGETREFLLRDVINQALRNTDNHARNHAVQRLPDGRVQLTPVFDLAPMFLDPELVPRALHWAGADDVRLDDWDRVLAALALPASEEAGLRRALHAFAEVVGRLPETMRDAGVEADVIEACRGAIDTQAGQLAALAH